MAKNKTDTISKKYNGPEIIDNYRLQIYSSDPPFLTFKFGKWFFDNNVTELNLTCKIGKKDQPTFSSRLNLDLKFEIVPRANQVAIASGFAGFLAVISISVVGYLMIQKKRRNRKLQQYSGDGSVLCRSLFIKQNFLIPRPILRPNRRLM